MPFLEDMLTQIENNVNVIGKNNISNYISILNVNTDDMFVVVKPTTKHGSPVYWRRTTSAIESKITRDDVKDYEELDENALVWVINISPTLFLNISRTENVLEYLYANFPALNEHKSQIVSINTIYLGGNIQLYTAPTATANATANATGGAVGVRHYVVVRSSRGSPGGRYSSKTGPAAAARKAATRRFGGASTKLQITVRETGTDREFTYTAHRVRLPKPFVRQINGKNVTSEHKTEVVAVR